MYACSGGGRKGCQCECMRECECMRDCVFGGKKREGNSVLACVWGIAQNMDIWTEEREQRGASSPNGRTRRRHTHKFQALAHLQPSYAMILFLFMARLFSIYTCLLHVSSLINTLLHIHIHTANPTNLFLLALLPCLL